jgi:single-stranded-DNA-specific exonuclease
MEQAMELYKLEPFGVSNNVPVFVMYGMTISNISSVGQGKHSKLILSKDNLVVCGMCFRKSPDELNLICGEEVDVMFNLDINEYQNNKSLQFIIKDIRPVKETLDCELEEQKLYQLIKEGDYNLSALSVEEKESIIPKRSDFAAVYNAVKKEIRLGRDTLSIRKIISLLKDYNISMRYVKLNFIISIFREMNILGVDVVDESNEIYKFSYIFVKNKADLDKSSILKKLKSASMQK